MILVAFALPQESRDFRQRLQAAQGRFGGREIQVVHLGVGATMAGAVARSSLAELKPEGMVCAGFAGGLDPRLATGDLVIADNFTDEPFALRARAVIGESPRRLFGPLTSAAAPVETIAAKQSLAEETGAIAVDMETAAVAEECRAAQVPLLAVRAISDTVETALPVPFEQWFDLEKQRPRRWALVRYLLKNPDRVGPFADFLRGLGPSRRALADYLVRFLAEESE